MQIRAGVAADAPAIAALHLENWRITYRGIVPDAVLDAITYESRRDHWATVLTARHGTEFVYVATDDAGRVVGIASGGPELTGDPHYRGELYVLHVHAGERRSGVGRALMRAVAARLAETNITSLLLWMLRDNYPACRFYERMGGSVVRAQPNEFAGVMIPDVAYGWADTATLRA